ncbi:NAD-dependent 4,6-dehydratase LegB [Gammaproteobacteria bacterium]|nr:NAD-dependent 4,6-dehydratase LegB [Gammaproteobacteria bacterium]MDA9175242.1 NAD-dependent 4,6-dehydratase LegB [Gammaproteobacteria bacterium]MDA9834590.1 NAD-dependent 4,6-dehydratase LegB [Gammaproteobacteria bacterium]MDA9979407.1 NAD-dependent 4,6-dehydratase LegB [Gammaproteobacteria bacterium]MDC3371994.1 NAD-dependent 4,6-dehydratase LegB [Gammaproteobacteria bacterium]
MINRNKTILVTGADGFIGSHLVEMLHENGFKVKALAQYNSFNNWGWLEDINCQKDIEIIVGDIRDPFFCQELCKDVDTIFHLAALIAIPYSYVAPQSYVATNITGTLNICKAALDNDVSRVIHTSTSEVYGSAQYVPIDEAHPLQAQSPYSASKIGADAMAMSFYNAFNLPLTIARPFNTYGPRQSARAFIPTIISQIASNQSQLKLGDTTPTRDLNFVLDTCKGFMLLAESNHAAGEVINIGSNTEISIGEVASIIKSEMDSDIEIVLDTQRIRPKKSEVVRLWCDNKKIKELTNFEPAYDIFSGLHETIAWFQDKENLAKYKSNIYNI